MQAYKELLKELSFAAKSLERQLEEDVDPRPNVLHYSFRVRDRIDCHDSLDKHLGNMSKLHRVRFSMGQSFRDIRFADKPCNLGCRKLKWAICETKSLTMSSLDRL